MDTKKIDFYYDCLDEATMLIYEEKKKDYLSCLITASEYFLGYENEKLSFELMKKLDICYQKLMQYQYANEEVRVALQLLIIKGFKHLQKYPLDLMTPDSISYLFAKIINNLYEDELTILDVALGTGNLINTISNYYPYSLSLIGIEKEEMLVRLAKVGSELQNNDLKIYLNDCLDPIYDKVDVVIGDLDSYEIDNHYFPYLVVNKYLHNLSERGIFIYLIANDFFLKPQTLEFKNQFPGTLLGLIVLPETMFAKKDTGKSILIGTHKKLDNFDMLVINMPSLKEQDKVNNTIKYINAWTNNLKGMIL